MTTSKGNMHHTNKNIKSTKQQDPTKLDKPLMTPLAQRTNKVFTKIINHKLQITTDITGKFPVTSNRVNKYLFLLYEYNNNGIFIRPIKAKSDINLMQVFKYLHGHLLTMELNPEYMILYNEASPGFQSELTSKDI